jgi:integrase
LAVVALFTGLRRGELLALRWSNVDLAAKVLQVREALQETKAGTRFKAPKTRSGIRDVTLPDLVVDFLREHRRRQLEQRVALGLGKLPDRALVFSRPDGEPLSPLGLSQPWRQVARSIGLPDFAFHATCSPWARSGCPVTRHSTNMLTSRSTTSLSGTQHGWEARSCAGGAGSPIIQLASSLAAGVSAGVDWSPNRSIGPQRAIPPLLTY